MASGAATVRIAGGGYPGARASLPAGDRRRRFVADSRQHVRLTSIAWSQSIRTTPLDDGA